MRRVVLIALIGCKASIGADMDATSGTADSASDDAFVPPPDAAITFGPWSNAAPLAYSAVADDDPTATGDLLELYFDRTDDIYRITRPSLNAAWSAPELVAELSSADDETTPEVSYDGLAIYFSSTRPGALGANDIWMSTRASRADAWSAPVHVPELSSTAAEGASASSDHLALVMDSARGGVSLDLFASERASASDPWGTPTALANVNTTESSEGNPMLSADKLTIYFDSNRTGDGELFVATRANPSAAFGLPQRIDELSDPAASDSDPWISPDGRTLLFTSNRDGTQKLWQATRSPM